MVPLVMKEEAPEAPETSDGTAVSESDDDDDDTENEKTLDQIIEAYSD